jgi:hypothetical protein
MMLPFMNTAKVLNNLTSVFTSIGVTSRRWRSLGAILKTNQQEKKKKNDIIHLN